MSQSSQNPEAVDSVEPQPATIDVTEPANEAPVTGAAAADADGPSYRHPFLVYSALRFGLLISAIASFVLLVPQRDAVGQRTGAYFRRLSQRIEDSKTAEDDAAAGDPDVDAAVGSASETSGDNPNRQQ